ncbi:hypothetical protein [Streptomyces coeruleorubidus]|uniref:Uncharacterized protein n=1 Tax=Streptomyces coeruleorubidus TaxID=116188 RepID=A0ABZ0K4S1_STRC4|nr:hypothetical protein [Streptomyces coeruleorubidus]WOT32901.1 hypothetical protein R5U08_01550 [Streptomyces coeruleorubidus]
MPRQAAGEYPLPPRPAGSPSRPGPTPRRAIRQGSANPFLLPDRAVPGWAILGPAPQKGVQARAGLLVAGPGPHLVRSAPDRRLRGHPSECWFGPLPVRVALGLGGFRSGRLSGCSGERWSPGHPYRSSLDGTTCAELTHAYRKATGDGWLQPLGLAHALVETAHHALTVAPTGRPSRRPSPERPSTPSPAPSTEPADRPPTSL